VITDKLSQVGGLKLGAAGIQVMGGASDGLIDGVTVLDSDRMAAGIMLDWGTVGPISSSDVEGSAIAFQQGRGYTTHPHQIVIRNIRIGRLTRRSVREYGSFGVRLSAVHDVTVSGVRIAETTEAAFTYSGGDLGFEYARPADRSRAHRGINVEDIDVNASGFYLVRTDTFADNVFRATQAGLRAKLDPIGVTDLTIRNVMGISSSRGDGMGVRVDHQRGGVFTDITVVGFRLGFFIDEQVYDLRLVRPHTRASRDAAISIEHPYRPPFRIVLEDPDVTGDTPASRTIIVGTSNAVTVRNRGSAVVRVDRGARGALVH